MRSTNYWFCTTIHGDPVYSNQFNDIYAGISRDESRDSEDICSNTLKYMFSKTTFENEVWLLH